MRTVPTITATALLLLAGCGLSESRNGTADAEKALLATQDAWMADWARHDSAKVVAGYAPDAHANYSGSASSAGRDTIGKGLAAYFADPAFKIEIANDRVRIDPAGGVATTGGKYHLEYSDPASHKPAQEDGNYVLVWQKQGDESWKVAEDITAVAPAATPAQTGSAS